MSPIGAPISVPMPVWINVPMMALSKPPFEPGDLALDSWRDRLDATVASYVGGPVKLAGAIWPALAKRVLDDCGGVAEYGSDLRTRLK